MNVMRLRTGYLNLHQQKGAALIIAIMILLILTVIGIYAVTTSTLETKISGNEKIMKDVFFAADGGIDCGRHVIVLVIKNKSIPFTTINGTGTTLLQEILGDPTSSWKSESPSIESTIGKGDTGVTLDRIKAEEPAGYVGEFGVPVSEKKTSVYYNIDSASTGTIAGGSSEIQATYLHVITTK